MDQLEKTAQLRSNSVHAFKKFADLVKLTVVQLPAKGQEGKLDEGTLHRSKSQKKLTESQVQKNSWGFREQNHEGSVASLCGGRENGI